MNLDDEVDKILAQAGEQRHQLEVGPLQAMLSTLSERDRNTFFRLRDLAWRHGMRIFRQGEQDTWFVHGMDAQIHGPFPLNRVGRFLARSIIRSRSEGILDK